MTWLDVTKSPTRDGNDDAAAPSRRRVLAGIGFAGMLAVAGARLLVSSPAEARGNTPLTGSEAAAPDGAKIVNTARVSMHAWQSIWIK